jgi:hypothetical protein
VVPVLSQMNLPASYPISLRFILILLSFYIHIGSPSGHKRPTHLFLLGSNNVTIRIIL